MKKNLWSSIMMTVVTTILLGLIYPMLVTGLARLVFPHKANGQLIVENGTVIGSSIIGPCQRCAALAAIAGQISARRTRRFFIV